MATERIKLQIGVPVELVGRLDSVAHEMGLSRSQLCAYYIGNGLRQAEMQRDVAQTLSDQIKPMMEKALSSTTSGK